MDVLLANPRGFCAGVDRAIEIVERVLDLFGTPIYVRHEVVHNRFVVDGLKRRGAVFVDSLEQVPAGGALVFSAHGVSRQVREEAEARGLRVFDATCPLVTKVHLEVARHCRRGFEVILIGHRGHPEVEGTMGQCREGRDRIRLVERVEDVSGLAVGDPSRIAYVTQTTLSMDDTAAIVAALRERFPAIQGPTKSDICYATQNRQDAVKALAQRCGLVLVVGSPNSSNSNRLREIAEKQGATAHLIDGADDIRREWLEGGPRVGLTAGASAPEVLVEEVIRRLGEWGAEGVEEQSGIREQVVFALPRELQRSSPPPSPDPSPEARPAMSDILVVGGGVIGLLTARELADAGAEVTLVEMGQTGRESSWAGGGILSPLYPWRYPDSVTVLAAWSQRLYPELCEALRAETGTDPELLRSGLLILDEDEHEQARAWADTHGALIRVIDAAGLRELEPGLGPAPKNALWMPEIAQVRNPRLASALRRSIEQRVRIREQEEVTELLVDKDRAAGAATRNGQIRAEQVVVCTGAWTAKLLERLGAKPEIQPVRGQIMLFLAKPDQVRHIVLLCERYVIPRRDGRILIGSTLEHTGFLKATTAEAKEELYRIAVDIFPLLKRTPIEDHWAGLRPGSPGGVPYIGGFPGIEGLYFNAGHFRNGLVTAPASARLAADLMLAREPIVDPAPYGLAAPR